VSGEFTRDQEKLRQEFNAWQARGRGESMARHHRPLTERALERMEIRTGDRVLDLGCGSGWATRLIAQRVGPRGIAVGVDISDAMIREAQQHPETPRNARFVCAPAEHIPWETGFFSHVLSVESFYYYADQSAVLKELEWLLAPGGRIFLLMCLFRGNPNAEKWVEQLAVPVHVRSAEEYRELLRAAGWRDVAVEVFTPPTDEPEPDEHAWACLAMATRP
jgi:ubiquinone/menaquinone biosynthesis C-methylase UbiE